MACQLLRATRKSLSDSESAWSDSLAAFWPGRDGGSAAGRLRSSGASSSPADLRPWPSSDSCSSLLLAAAEAARRGALRPGQAPAELQFSSASLRSLILLAAAAAHLRGTFRLPPGSGELSSESLRQARFRAAFRPHPFSKETGPALLWAALVLGTRGLLLRAGGPREDGSQAPELARLSSELSEEEEEEEVPRVSSISLSDNVEPSVRGAGLLRLLLSEALAESEESEVTPEDALTLVLWPAESAAWLEAERVEEPAGSAATFACDLNRLCLAFLPALPRPTRSQFCRLLNLWLLRSFSLNF